MLVISFLSISPLFPLPDVWADVRPTLERQREKKRCGSWKHWNVLSASKTYGAGTTPISLFQPLVLISCTLKILPLLVLWATLATFHASFSPDLANQRWIAGADSACSCGNSKICPEGWAVHAEDETRSPPSAPSHSRSSELDPLETIHWFGYRHRLLWINHVVWIANTGRGIREDSSQIEGSNLKMPSFERRLFMVLLSTTGPVMIDTLIKQMGILLADVNSLSFIPQLENNVTLRNKLIEWLPELRSTITLLQRLHLVIFYFFGTHHELSKRVTGVNYVSFVPWLVE